MVKFLALACASILMSCKDQTTLSGVMKNDTKVSGSADTLKRRALTDQELRTVLGKFEDSNPDEDAINKFVDSLANSGNLVYVYFKKPASVDICADMLLQREFQISSISLGCDLSGWELSFSNRMLLKIDLLLGQDVFVNKRAMLLKQCAQKFK